MTFLDEKGNIPEAGPSTWQFNFKFNLTEDMYAEDSVDLLQVIDYLHQLAINDHVEISLFFDHPPTVDIFYPKKGEG